MLRRAMLLLPVAALALQAQGTTKRVPVITGQNDMNLIVDGDGTVKVWGTRGNTDAAYFGDGTESGPEKKTPTQLPGVHDIVDASVGYSHALIVQSDGTVLGWGHNNSCELGVKDDHRRVSPMVIPGVSGAVQVGAGMEISVALIKDGTVKVWGNNSNGMLATGKSGGNCNYVPTAVPGLTGVKKIAVANDFALALKGDGTVWGWGSNGNGVLCDGTTQDRDAPVQMKGIANAVDIDAGARSVIVLADGTVWMCGDSDGKSLTGAAKGKQSTPWKIAGVSGAVSARNDNSTMARLKDGSLRGWGDMGQAALSACPAIAQYWATGNAYVVCADGTVLRWGVYEYDKEIWDKAPKAFTKVKTN